jgi:hypothetical protein
LPAMLLYLPEILKSIAGKARSYEQPDIEP